MFCILFYLKKIKLSPKVFCNKKKNLFDLEDETPTTTGLDALQANLDHDITIHDDDFLATNSNLLQKRDSKQAQISAENPNKKKSKGERMKEIIRKSKDAKLQRWRDREDQRMLFQELKGGQNNLMMKLRFVSNFQMKQRGFEVEERDKGDSDFMGMLKGLRGEKLAVPEREDKEKKQGNSDDEEDGEDIVNGKFF